MGKGSFKTIRLFLKLILLFQIYSHHCYKAEATAGSFPARFDKGEVSEETGLNDQISDADTLGSSTDRPKRPARLLPLKIILGKEKNSTEKEDMSSTRFYGPATSCNELLKIGYTRNGFYLVKETNATSNSHVEMVDCQFSNPSGVNEVKEKRLRLITLKTNSKKSHQQRSVGSFIEFNVDTIRETNKERSKRPGRLLPLQLLSAKEEKNIPKPFYGPPTNCIELGKLGFTLNGYYLVKESNNGGQLEVILCRFQLPPLKDNETSKEERLGFISLDQNIFFTDKIQSSDKGDTIEETGSIIGRKSRPARLLPLKLISDGKNKNKTQERAVQRFNSNPVNCDDLGKLGYTLNGFYIVNGISESRGQFVVTFCQFQLQLTGAKKRKVVSTKEKRFGIIRSQSCQAEKEAGTCKSDLEYMRAICDKSFCDGENVKNGSIFHPPRMANLINGHGKGFDVYWNQPTDGWSLIQWDTRGSKSKGNIWSWNETSLGSGDRHLCNGFGKCVASWKTNVLANNGTLSWDQMGWIHLKQWDYSNEEGQRFNFIGSQTHPGFYVIKDEFGKCVGIPENTDRSGAEIRACYCNSSDAGQRWQWHYLDDKIKDANLINGLGKCLKSSECSRYPCSIKLYQFDCNPIFYTMLWSWNQVSLSSGDRHICDGRGGCVATPGNSNGNSRLIAFHHVNELGQRFSFVDLPTHPGFYVIKNDHGKCLSVEGNTNQNGAEIWANECNPMEAGQRWKWHN